MAEPKKEKKEKKPFNKKKLGVTVVVVVVVIAAAGLGFNYWHEQPSFCTAICHDPMPDGYLTTYESQPGEPSVDKWGNEVSDSRAMMAAVHQSYAGATCMSCHNPSLLEQVSEGVQLVTGDYETPPTERDDDDLVYYRNTNLTQFFTYDGDNGVSGDELCLNDSCHRMTENDLVKATANYPTNPHQWYLDTEGATCTDCHKGHRASVMACEGNDDYLPSGWLTAEEAEQLPNQVGKFERKH